MMTADWDLRTFSLPLRLDSSPEEKLRRSKACLFRALSLHTTIAFTGAGCSAYHGTPLWREFVHRLLKATQARLSRAQSEDSDSPLDIGRIDARLAAYEDAFAGRVGSRSLMHVAGFCRRVLAELDAEDGALRSFLASTFEKPTRLEPTVKKAPYRALIDLGIDRFVTTNYDAVLERLLDQEDRRYESFTQEARFTDRLAVFPLSNHRAFEDSVAIFHCHGSFDRPESIIASEEDFQRWYLRPQNPQGECLRQCLDLTLGSNPILFVGYGLGDEDLLRPLRMLNAMSSGNRLTEPLFALLPDDDRTRFDYYYSRFGVHVIPYTVEDATVDGHSVALHRTLTQLKEEWLEWRESWERKPALRSAEVHAEGSKGVGDRQYYHFFPDLDREDWTLELPTLHRVWERVYNAVVGEDDVRLLFLHGPSGSGKSYAAWRLLENCGEGWGRFYWSSYYDQDWLNGFKAAVSFLSSSSGEPGAQSLVESIRSCLLSAPPSILVFDGFERLLKVKPDGRAEPINQTVRRILRLICDLDHNVKVVVCSTLVPDAFDGSSRPTAAASGPLADNADKRGERRRWAEVEAPRLEVGDYGKLPGCSAMPDRVAAFCSLLGGHVYATHLLESLIRVSQERPDDETDDMVRDLVRRLAGVSRDRRVQRLVSFVVSYADAWDDAGAAGGLLERLSLFHKPPPKEIVDTAYRATRLAMEKTPEILEDACDDLLDRLRRLGLLFVVRTGSGRGEERYMVHEAVRVNVFRNRFLAKERPLPVFPFATFASSVPAASHPGSERAEETLRGLFEVVIREADGSTGKTAQERRLYTQYAYSLVRSCMDANAATRWCKLGRYNDFSLRVEAAAKHCAPGTWDFAPASTKETVEHAEAPLDAEELSWLYNDIGLALFARGDLRDAQAIFDQADTIRQLIRPFTEERFHETQALLQFGHLLIERGRLAQAQKILESALKLSTRYEHPECVARANGHLALIANLRGNYDESLHLFELCLEPLGETTNLRGRSHFLRLKADLLLRRGKDDKAYEELQLALSIANAGNYPDLVHNARNSLGRYYRHEKKYVLARREYEAARTFAAKMDVTQLEAHVLRELARLSLDLGDFDNARLLAQRSLRLANDLSLALQQAHSLLVLGLANARGSLHQLGLAQIRFARHLAQDHQYWSLDRHIEETLAEENLRVDQEGLDPVARAARDV